MVDDPDIARVVRLRKVCAIGGALVGVAQGRTVSLDGPIRGRTCLPLALFGSGNLPFKSRRQPLPVPTARVEFPPDKAGVPKRVQVRIVPEEGDVNAVASLIVRTANMKGLL